MAHKIFSAHLQNFSPSFWKGEKEHFSITFRHLVDTFIQIDSITTRVEKI